MNGFFSGIAFLTPLGMAIALTGQQIASPSANATRPLFAASAPATRPLFPANATQERSPATQPRTQSSAPASAPASAQRTQEQAIIVDLSERSLCYRGECHRAWIGSPATPTPTGEFRILKIGDYLLDGAGRKINDAPVMVLQWLPSGWAVAIHGGGAQFGEFTQSCVRLEDGAARKLAAQVSVGQKVIIQE